MYTVSPSPSSVTQTTADLDMTTDRTDTDPRTSRGAERQELAGRGSSPERRSLPGPLAIGRAGAVGALGAVGVVGALSHLRHRFERSQMFLPEAYPSGIWNPEPFGLAAEDVWFESADGTALHGWWVPAKRARGTVLFCHGNAGNITSQIAAYRYLQRFRLNVFAFDYRGYGRSEGRPSEAGVLADAHAAHDVLGDRFGVEDSRLVIYGHSLGGAIAVDCAVHRPAAGLIVQSSFTDTREVARERFGSLPVHWVALRRFRSVDKVRELTLPKLIIHGTDDGTIGHSIGERLFEAAAEPKQWVSVPRAGHSDVHRHGGLALRRALRKFFRGVLGA